MSFNKIIAAVNTRMTEVLERFKTKILSNLSEEAAEELGEINVSSFVKKAMKGLEEEIKENMPKESPKKEEKGASKKAKKDKNAPKGAKNAYILFCADNRDQVKEENPEMKATEIISELARLWKDADEDMKAEYQEKATEDKKRYQEEMSDYVPSEEESPKKVAKVAKGSKGAKGAKADSPKRPLTSYMMFAQEHREKAKASHPEAKSNDIAKILGSWWKEADEEVKQEFKEKAQSALDKFNGKDVEVVSPKKVKKVEVEVEKVEPPKKEKGNKSKK